MKVSPLNASSNVCTFNVELTWEQARALYEFVPALLAVLGPALSERSDASERQATARKVMEAHHAAQKAEWAALAADCEKEIQRRSNNGPSARRTLIKQIAAERGMSTELLSSILRVYSGRDKKNEIEIRILKAGRLKAAGYKVSEIATQLGVTTRQVRNYLAGSAGGRAKRSDVAQAVQK
jgi:hypothetical protein